MWPHVFVCVVNVHLHESVWMEMPAYCYSTSQCVFSLHRRLFMHCLQTHCVSKQECWCQCTLCLSSCFFTLPSSLVLWLASVLVKGMRGTVCNKAIYTLPILSSFIRLQKRAETHTRRHTTEVSLSRNRVRGRRKGQGLKTPHPPPVHTTGL